MATHKSITHDGGPPVSSYYTLSIIDPGTRGSITGASALNGSVFGLQLVMSGGFVSARFRESMSALPGNTLRLRVYFDPNSVSISSGGSDIRVDIQDNTITKPQGGLRFSFNSTGDAYRVSGRVIDDAANNQSSSEYALSDVPHCVEIAVNRASSTLANDGSFVLYVDGVAKETVSGINLYDNWPNINQIDVFCSATGVGDSGSAYLDEILVDDSSASSLCGTANDEWGAAPMKKPADIDMDGSFIYIAALDSLGQPALIKFNTDLGSDGSVVFQPGSGDNIGVQCGRRDSDVVWIAGDFGGTDTVEKSEDAGASFSVKDDSTFDPVTSFAVGPDSDERVLIFTDAGASVASTEVYETIDDGASWSQKNSGLGFVSKDVARLDINPEELVTGNEAGASDNIDYSPNTGQDLEDYSTGFPTQDVTKVIVG
jgi:hypothetical protein